jgi:hypothetical protein
MEWVVACDQPFDEVEKPEFIALMEYTHHGSSLNFRVPGRNVVKSRVMKMGEDTVEGTRKMFEVRDFIIAHLFILNQTSRNWIRRSPSLVMRGRRATSIRSLRWLHTMSQMTAI